MSKLLLQVVSAVTLLSLAFISLTILQPLRAQAASLSNFSPGHIIDDGVFFNSSSMNTNEIQLFLNSKVPLCDTNGLQATTHPNGLGSYYSRAEWGALNGYTTPFVCLKDFRQDVPATTPDAYCTSSTSSGNKTAAQIISDVSSACSINPQVLIVLLQKEQGLITDDWPWTYQYRSATGYGCPDTAACDSAYYGFFNQVYNAAHQFQRYVKQPMSFNYRAAGTFYVLYNPDASCGGTNLYLQNGSTAALYNYTPYQPNQAALAAGYGTAPSCGAYGNRNFWLYFTDWFGTTFSPNYSAQPVWQSVFTDNSKSNPLGWNATLTPGQQAYAVVILRNTGNTTWTNANGTNETRLATYNWARQSPFCASGWIIGCTRPATLVETSVPPGSTGTFEFPITAPTGVATYDEGFGLVIDGKSTFSSGFVNFHFVVESPSYTAQPVWQQVFTDSSKTVALGWNADLSPNRSAYVIVAMKNTGNITWTRTGGQYETRLATYNWARQSPFCASGWIIGCTRPGRMNEVSVAPGNIGTFEFPVRAPIQPGLYDEGFGLVIDGKSTFSSGFVNFQMNIANTYTAQPVWQQVFTDSSKTVALGWNGGTLSRGQSYWAVVSMKNSGTVTWTKGNGADDVRLATNPWGRQSNLCTGAWIFTIPSCTRAAIFSETNVPPGSTGTFEFPVTIPSNQPSGIINEGFGLVVDGKTTFSKGFMNFQLNVL